MADALIDAGLLSRDAPAERAAFGGAPARSQRRAHQRRTRAEPRSSSLRLAHVASFLAALAWTRRALRSRTLYSIACEIRDRKVAAGGAFDESQAIELVGIFRRLRPAYLRGPRPLPVSFAGARAVPGAPRGVSDLGDRRARAAMGSACLGSAGQAPARRQSRAGLRVHTDPDSLTTTK